MLAFESIIVFLGGLAVFGLKALPEPIPQWWGIVVGSVLALVDAADRRCAALSLGDHPRLGAAGRSSPSAASWCRRSFLVAIIFGGMWAYATIKGASLDARNARLAAEADTPNGD